MPTLSSSPLFDDPYRQQMFLACSIYDNQLSTWIRDAGYLRIYAERDAESRRFVLKHTPSPFVSHDIHEWDKAAVCGSASIHHWLIFSGDLRNEARLMEFISQVSRKRWNTNDSQNLTNRCTIGYDKKIFLNSSTILKGQSCFFTINLNDFCA